jgi:hypothetical protein
LSNSSCAILACLSASSLANLAFSSASPLAIELAISIAGFKSTSISTSTSNPNILF